MHLNLLLLSDPSSPHTIKWARSLGDAGVNLLIVGLGSYTGNHYDHQPAVRVVTLNQEIIQHEGRVSKLSYLRALPLIRKLIQTFRPDILHAHYASSYGLLGALSGFHPFILSVWGSDVFSFPNRSCLHRSILKFNLARADRILSTSHAMAQETRRYTQKSIEVTPFGIDLQQFRPQPVRSLFAPEDIVIGMVKTLDKKYGIEYAVRAFGEVREKRPALPLKLLIVGGGRLESELRRLVDDLGLRAVTKFTGSVPYDDTPHYHNMLSISVAVSENESFGVSVLEASACERPVVVSNVGGLPEIVEHGVTGLVVPSKNPHAAAASIQRLVDDAPLRKNMGAAGRKRVQSLYNWDDNVRQMLNIYRKSQQT